MNVCLHNILVAPMAEWGKNLELVNFNVIFNFNAEPQAGFSSIFNKMSEKKHSDWTFRYWFRFSFFGQSEYISCFPMPLERHVSNWEKHF